MGGGFLGTEPLQATETCWSRAWVAACPRSAGKPLKLPILQANQVKPSRRFGGGKALMREENPPLGTAPGTPGTANLVAAQCWRRGLLCLGVKMAPSAHTSISECPLPNSWQLVTCPSRQLVPPG